MRVLLIEDEPVTAEALALMLAGERCSTDKTGSGEEGIALANDSDYGLYDYVYSGDTVQGMRVAQQLRCGNVGSNTVNRNPETPFGGFKKSGLGRDGGSFAMHAYTEWQSQVWPG